MNENAKGLIIEVCPQPVAHILTNLTVSYERQSNVGLHNRSGRGAYMNK